MNKIKIDDRLLDELVAGELRGEAYRQTLVAIDAQPHLWRNCALAFLREQAIQQELRALAKGDVDWSGGKSKSLAESDLATPSHPGFSAALHHRQATTAASSAVAPSTLWSDEGRKVLAQRLATLAALLLVSFSVGWLGAGLRVDDTAGMNAGNANLSSAMMGGGVASSASDLAAGTKPQPASMVQPGSIVQQAPTTVLSRDGLQYLGMNQMKLPRELFELERAGKVRIDTMEMWVPVTLEDGSSAIFPVLEYRVEPIARSY